MLLIDEEASVVMPGCPNFSIHRTLSCVPNRSPLMHIQLVPAPKKKKEVGKAVSFAEDGPDYKRSLENLRREIKLMSTSRVIGWTAAGAAAEVKPAQCAPAFPSVAQLHVDHKPDPLPCRRANCLRRRQGRVWCGALFGRLVGAMR
jgi:hypothetical protein